ncbi:MAG: DNA mismatch repair endonuclease MutL [Thermoplasmatota archaeon]
MGRRIRVLDEKTVNKISAGEVVESPSSVVKELVENSLDAGASEIVVSIDGGGIKRIQVSDDGCGMSGEDARIAFTRHSTSKIKDIDDLSTLKTMGFRGEALASISAVSRVELVTNEGGEEENGTRIVVSAGRMLVMESAGCPRGTTVTVSDLFENVPARKKFLRSTASERGRCQDAATRIMLANPGVSFRLIVDGDEKINTRATGDLRDRAAAVIGVKTAKGMMEIPPTDCGGISVSGLISLPWDTRSNSGGITLSIGSRVTRNRNIVEALRRGYGSRLMKGRFPIAVINLEVPPDRVDVNVHPTKALVKFSEEERIIGCIESAVGRTVFGPGGPRRKVRTEPGIPDDQHDETPIINRDFSVPRIDRAPRQMPLMEGEVRVQEPIRDQWSRIPRIEGVSKLPPAIPEGAPDLNLRVIGQLDRSYILCELGSDLLLVDQHAAHERIRLEMLRNKYQDGGEGVQELLEPLHVEMDPASAESLLQMSEELKGMGFVYEDFGGSDIVIRALPTFMGRMEAHQVLLDLASGNEYHDDCTPPDRQFLPVDIPLKDRIIALSACRGAVKAHDQLSLNEMEDLLHDLLNCEIPMHCAHGRPTMIRLPMSALERWFKRIL